jgi:hypothetical protein
MKIYMLILISILVLSSCSKQEDIYINSEVLGKWKLIEINDDPGDGSGTFEPVDSDRIIEFLKNSTYITNGSSCWLSTVTGENSTGKFNSTLSILDPDENCAFEDFAEIYFEIKDSFLILSGFGCLEGGYRKFERVTD